MKIVFDEPKRLTNLAAHGLDFADLDLDFFAASSVFSANDGRYKSAGAFGGTVLAVIVKPLGSEAIAVISMRRASRKERNAHENNKTENQTAH